MIPYSMQKIIFLHRLAKDFCSLHRILKYQIGLAYELVTADDANLEEDELEIKIWEGIVKYDMFEDLAFTVQDFMDKAI